MKTLDEKVAVMTAYRSGATDGTQRIVMPMCLKDVDDLSRTHRFVKVTS